MELVIDANIVISILISQQNKARDLLFSEEIILYAPEFLIEEINKHKNEVIEKSKLSEEEFNLFLSIISSKIKFIPLSEFRQFIQKAKDICPDPNDIEYFALALKLNCPVWSNDKNLKRQDFIKVVSTEEI